MRWKKTKIFKLDTEGVMSLCPRSIVHTVSQLPKQIHYLTDSTLTSLSLFPSALHKADLPSVSGVILNYLNQWFSFRVILPLGDIWQYLETFWLLQLAGGCSWHVGGKGLGCCHMTDNVQDSPPQETGPAQCQQCQG